jgi:hypothetical protein
MMRSLNSITRAAGLAILAAQLGGCEAASPAQPELTPEYSNGGNVPPFVFPDGCCYYEGHMVRTVVPPAASPKPGRDNFYAFPSAAAAGQKGVVGVAPGDTNYHGGHWKFHAVTWNVTPYLLTSEAAVLAAASAGHVSVARLPANDFKCPIQP